MQSKKSEQFPLLRQVLRAASYDSPQFRKPDVGEIMGLAHLVEALVSSEPEPSARRSGALGAERARELRKSRGKFGRESSV